MDGYVVLGSIAEGAYGEVLRARHAESRQIVAIKRFKDSEHDDETVRKTAAREVKVLRLLRQPNIVHLREAFKVRGRMHLVFEFVQMNLLELIESRSRGLGEDSVRRYVHQLAAAVDWCHSHEIVHRDIKPENLLVDPAKRMLKLCDFGFARTMPRGGGGGGLTDYVATRWYRAPELLLGASDYGFEVDVWAIGCIMGEMVDGQPMFAGDSDVDQLSEIQKVMGSVTPQQKERFMRHPPYRGIKFPDLGEDAALPSEQLRRRFGGKISADALAFLESAMAMDPRDRLSAAQCLEHPYFDELNGPLGPATRAPALTHTRSSADTGGRSDRASPSRTRKVEDRPASGLELSDLSSDKGDYEYSRGGGGEGGVRDRDRDASYGAAELVRETREVLSSLDNLRITPHRSPHSQVALGWRDEQASSSQPQRQKEHRSSRDNRSPLRRNMESIYAEHVEHDHWQGQGQSKRSLDASFELRGRDPRHVKRRERNEQQQLRQHQTRRGGGGGRNERSYAYDPREWERREKTQAYQRGGGHNRRAAHGARQGESYEELRSSLVFCNLQHSSTQGGGEGGGGGGTHAHRNKCGSYEGSRLHQSTQKRSSRLGGGGGQTTYQRGVQLRQRLEHTRTISDAHAGGGGGGGGGVSVKRRPFALQLPRLPGAGGGSALF